MAYTWIRHNRKLPVGTFLKQSWAQADLELIASMPEEDDEEWAEQQQQQDDIEPALAPEPMEPEAIAPGVPVVPAAPAAPLEPVATTRSPAPLEPALPTVPTAPVAPAATAAPVEPIESACGKRKADALEGYAEPLRNLLQKGLITQEDLVYNSMSFVSLCAMLFVWGGKGRWKCFSTRSKSPGPSRQAGAAELHVSQKLCCAGGGWQGAALAQLVDVCALSV
jgi:hypothetical protein